MRCIKRTVLGIILSGLLLSANPVWAQGVPNTPPNVPNIQPDNEQNSAIKEIDAQNTESAKLDIPLDAKPRDVYNDGIKDLEANAFDQAIERFQFARDRASNDNELRYSAAFNLAFAYAKKADSLGDPNTLEAQPLSEVIEQLRLSAAWFRDAVRQRTADLDARKNLEIVLKQVQTVTDILNSKYNKLENQLDALLDEQRGMRENTRVLADSIQNAGESAELLTFQKEFKNGSKIQRGILTQANLVAENTADELAHLESIAEDQRTQEQAYRIFQLQNVSPLLEQARQQMANGRRQLRDLSIENALRYTTQAFYLLKQARERLENPLQTLNAMIQDQAELLRLSTARLVLKNPEQFVNQTSTQGDIQSLPLWLNQDLLNETQGDILTRSQWLTQFLNAILASPQPEAPQGQEAQQEQAQKQREQMQEAIPFLEAANEAMQDAKPKLILDELKDALEDEQNAMESLMDAAERFTDLKHLIERTYQQQLAISELAVPKLDNAQNSDTPQIPIDERIKVVQKYASKNIDRLTRLQNFLQEEAAKTQQTNSNEVSQEQVQQAQQILELAENLRQKALDANKTLNLIAKNELQAKQNQDVESDVADILDAQETLPNAITSWIEPAQEAEKAIEQLRILFFSIVEHIVELARQQENTLDRTADAAAERLKSEVSLFMEPILDRERQHESLASGLTEALLEQSKQLQEQPPEGANADQAREMAQKYAQAAGELQAASAAMRQATAHLETETPAFEEGMKAQEEAEDHLKAAIAILQPPQQQQKQQEQQQEQQQMSQQQADKKLQQIRERENQRRKDKQRANAPQPVEKDW